MSTRRNRHVVYALSCLDGPPVYVGVTGRLEERIAGHWDACRHNDRPLQVWMRQLRCEADLTVTTLCEWQPSTEVLFAFHEQRVEEVLIRQIAERTLRYRGIVTLNLRCNPFRSFGVNPAVRFDAIDSIVKLHGWRAWALAEEICPYNDGGPAFASPSYYANTGMSLLDYFAGQALAGLTARCCFTPNGVAESAYQYAQAMLSYKQNQQAVSESQQVALGIGGQT